MLGKSIVLLIIKVFAFTLLTSWNKSPFWPYFWKILFLRVGLRGHTNFQYWVVSHALRLAQYLARRPSESMWYCTAQEKGLVPWMWNASLSWKCFFSLLRGVHFQFQGLLTSTLLLNSGRIRRKLKQNYACHLYPIIVYIDTSGSVHGFVHIKTN